MFGRHAMGAAANVSVHGREHEIPSLSTEEWDRAGEQARRDAGPLVVRSAFAASVALNTWTPAALLERIGEHRVLVAVDLPDDDSAPYLEDNDVHAVSMTFSQFIDRLRAGERCYLHQAPLKQFGELSRDLHDLGRLVVVPLFGINLWAGRKTRSGLHFDGAENFLVQLFGRKRAVLIPPGFGRHLRVLPDNPSKSRLSAIEIETLGGILARIPRWRAGLGPGDALYIPPGWWHYLSSDEMSISINVWHGRHLSASDERAALVQAGPAVWGRIVRDFIWCGVLGRPYRQHLFCPPPLGVDLYRLLRTRRSH